MCYTVEANYNSMKRSYATVAAGPASAKPAAQGSTMKRSASFISSIFRVDMVGLMFGVPMCLVIRPDRSARAGYRNAF